MTGPAEPPPIREDRPAPTGADDEFARGYSEGFGEGLREALRDVLQNASRGHTAQELRILIESRLARIDEEVELKRRSLVRPPRRPPWGSLLRPPQPPEAWTPLRSALPLAPVPPGASALLREESPRRALELLERSQARFPSIVVVTTHPPTLSEEASAKAIVLRAGSQSADSENTGLSPGEISGRIREATSQPGGALVYLDAVEFLATEYTLDTTLRFVYWLCTQATRTGSSFIACVDPKALDPKDLSRLQRAFNTFP
jgi:hypothetical protein